MIPGTAVPGTQDITTVTITSLTDNSVSDQALNRTTVLGAAPTVYLPIIVKPSGTQPLPTPTPTPPNIPPTLTPTPTTIPPCTATGVDLIVTQIEVVPNPPVAGAAATIFVTIRNQGSRDVTYGNNFYVDFYVDRVPQPLLIGDLYAGIQGADLEAGATQTYMMNQPADFYIFTSGSHQLYAQVDTDNTVNECPHEDNNTLGPVTIAATGFSQDNENGATDERLNSSGSRGTPTPESLIQERAATPTATPTLTPVPVNRP
jgi:hypothetical protein